MLLHRFLLGFLDKHSRNYHMDANTSREDNHRMGLMCCQDRMEHHTDQAIPATVAELVVAVVVEIPAAKVAAELVATVEAELVATVEAELVATVEAISYLAAAVTLAAVEALVLAATNQGPPHLQDNHRLPLYYLQE